MKRNAASSVRNLIRNTKAWSRGLAPYVGRTLSLQRPLENRRIQRRTTCRGIDEYLARIESRGREVPESVARMAAEYKSFIEAAEQFKKAIEVKKFVLYLAFFQSAATFLMRAWVARMSALVSSMSPLVAFSASSTLRCLI